MYRHCRLSDSDKTSAGRLNGCLAMLDEATSSYRVFTCETAKDSMARALRLAKRGRVSEITADEPNSDNPARIPHSGSAESSTHEDLKNIPQEQIFAPISILSQRYNPKPLQQISPDEPVRTLQRFANSPRADAARIIARCRVVGGSERSIRH
ncbi:hypothetical protein MRB53_037497 [Persea americana]|nr:hypothetical protein MRB53_037497 [Persea americana]